MNIFTRLPKPFFVLAPMYDVTDTVFRRVIATLPYPTNLDAPLGSGEEQAGAIRGYGPPDMYVTEFVSVDGLQSAGRQGLLKYLQFTEQERPLIAQIWGKNPENYYKTAQQLVKMGFDGVDINMGCPDKTIVKNGCCAALINNRELATEIIQAVREGAGTLPVSVKTRLGLNEVDLSWHEFLFGQKLDALTIHGRTAKQMSKVPADWNKIAEIRELRDKLSPDTIIIGNGDVMTRAQGEKLANDYKVDGIMIGRGVFNDPFAFAQTSPWESYTKEQRIDLYKRHVELFVATYKNDERKVHGLNKFCKIYIQGFDGAKELREKYMAAKSAPELLSMLTR